MIDAKNIYEGRNRAGLAGALARAAVFVYLHVRPPLPFKGRTRLVELWNRDRTSTGGRALALGSNNPPASFNALAVDQLVQIDMKPLPFVDVVADAERLTEQFEAGSVDLVISTSMLEHTKHPEAVFREVRNILKTGGLFYLEVPWTFPLHGEPDDYWRFSKYGLEELAKGSQLTVLASGSVVSPHGALYTFLKVYLAEVFSFGSSVVFHALDYILSYVLWPLGCVETLFRLSSPEREMRTDSIIYVWLQKRD